MASSCVSAFDGADVDEKSLLRRILNRLLARFANLMPGATSVRPFLHRLRGVNITGRVFIGDDVYIENEYPEQVWIDEGAQICLKSTLIAHSRGAGRIVIEKDAFVGAGCLIIATPGKTLTIGSGSIITAASVVASDVPNGVLFGSEKGRPLALARVPLKMDTPFDSFLAGLRPLPPSGNPTHRGKGQ